jgi:hypothetical protein
MLVALLVLLPTVRIAYAQPIVRTLPTDPGPTGAQLSAELDPNGQDTWWVILMHDEQTAYAWTPVGCTGEKDGNVGRQVVSCYVTGLTPDHSYGDMIVACWGPDPLACPGTDVEGDGLEVSWRTPQVGNYATTTTTSASSIQSYTMIVTNVLTILSRSESSTTSQHLGPGFDFALSVFPSAVSVKQGDTAYYTVQVQYSDPSYYGTMINLQLMGLGPGMNWQVTQNGDLMITTTPASPTGTYTISLTGSANGVTHQTGATLIVTSQQPTTSAVTTAIVSDTPFDYSVTVSPFTQSVEIGGTTSYVVSVLPLSGSPVSVSLTVTGCPGDVRSSFTTPSGNPPYTSTLNLDLSTSSANAGAYTLTVVATAAGNVKTSTATLMIKEKAAQTTVVQTTTGGLSTTTTIPPPGVGGDLTWIIVGILAVLIVIFAALALRRHQPAYQPTPPAQPTPPTAAEEPKPSSVYCVNCGTENPSTNEFCGKCGTKLS